MTRSAAAGLVAPAVLAAPIARSQRKDPTLNEQSLPAASIASARPVAHVSGPASLWAAALSLGAATAALAALLPLAATSGSARAMDDVDTDSGVPDDAAADEEHLRSVAEVNAPDTGDDDPIDNVVAFEQGRDRRNRRTEAGQQRAEKREERVGQRQERRDERADAKERNKETRPERPAPANRTERMEQKDDRASQRSDRVAQREERKQTRHAEPAPVLEAIAPQPTVADDPAAAPALAETALVPAPNPSSSVLVVPLLNTAALSPRAVDRARGQLATAEQAVLNADGLTATIAPLIRHVNTVTEQLNEAQLTVGRLTAERDALRQRLAQAEGVTVEQLGFIATSISASPEMAEAHAAKLKRLEARADRNHESSDGKAPNRILTTIGIQAQSESDEHFKLMTRRRQVLAAAVMLTIFLVMRAIQSNGGSTSGFSRDSLAEIQGIGSLMQVFIVCWMLYRIVRVGGRGVRWVFPSNTNNKRRRH
ncbi:MAG: hypothetical protein IT337_09625 [Thermomicrobiales bacterium]|nr:hypothetical protein [Thermomicrobiales bacterium]